MAQRTFTELVDDLDGTPEAEKPVKRRRFTIDGVQYEADYTDDNHEGLKAAVAKYVQSARVISRPKTAPATRGVTGSKKQQARIDRAQLDQMRDWINRQPELRNVSKFGRIPDDLKAEYDRYHDNLSAKSDTNGHVEVEPPALEEGVPQFSSV